MRTHAAAACVERVVVPGHGALGEAESSSQELGALAEHGYWMISSARVDRLRDRQTERLGGLEVDHQLELDRLLDWEVGRLGAFEDSAHLGPRPLKHVGVAGPVGYEPACVHELLGAERSP